jgi:hypothetical protein
MRPRSVVPLALVLAALLVETSVRADADQRYRVEGKDSFQVGARDLRSEILYSGQETLSVRRSGTATRYTAHVDYVKIDGAQRSDERGSFESTLLPSGEQRDDANRDPDYLTVLNQPFSVQLDAPTLRDLGRLRKRVPFQFASPMTRAPLHGYLQRIGDAIAGRDRLLAVAFNAGGPMRGTLPDRPALSLAGQIRMTGTAYYRYTDALMMALDATLTITGNLDDRGHQQPVTIVYKRSIRAEPHPPLHEASRASPLPDR